MSFGAPFSCSLSLRKLFLVFSACMWLHRINADNLWRLWSWISKSSTSTSSSICAESFLTKLRGWAQLEFFGWGNWILWRFLLYFFTNFCLIQWKENCQWTFSEIFSSDVSKVPEWVLHQIMVSLEVYSLPDFPHSKVQ